MSTLFDALLETAQLCGIMRSGLTTASGSTTTLIDTTAYENDDYYNNGTLFIRSGTYANTTKRITDFVQSSGTLTFTPAVTPDAVAANVYYSVTNARREALVQSINQAMLFMGEYTLLDETLTVTDNATEYTLPSGVSNVKRIEVYTSSSSPYGFNPVTAWREMGGKVYLPCELNHGAGQTVRLYYNKFHDAVNADTDTISDHYNLKRLAWTATYMFLLNRMQYSGNSDERENILLANAQQQAQRLANAFPVQHIERDPILARW